MRASESQRSVACPASLALPRGLPRTAKADEGAGYGKLVHHWKETGESEPTWADAKDIRLLEKKLLITGVHREAWWPDTGQHEVTFAYHLDTGALKVELHENSDAWKAQFGLRYLTGTADYVGTHTDGTPWIDDLKTGRWPVDVNDNAQLKSYSVLHPRAARVWTTVTQWPKYPLDGFPVRTGVYVTALDLADHLGDLLGAADNPLIVRPGEQCTFCDCREAHPATAWMQHYRHRALPSCASGLVQIYYKSRATERALEGNA